LRDRVQIISSRLTPIRKPKHFLERPVYFDLAKTINAAKATAPQSRPFLFTYHIHTGSIWVPYSAPAALRPSPARDGSTQRAASLTTLPVPWAVCQRAPRSRLALPLLIPAPGMTKGRTLRCGPAPVPAPSFRRARNTPSVRYGRRYPRPAPRRAAP